MTGAGKKLAPKNDKRQRLSSSGEQIRGQLSARVFSGLKMNGALLFRRRPDSRRVSLC